MEEIKAVDILLKLEDGEHAGDFAVQQRSEHNKSSHYICQATWAGKFEEGESPMDAAKRECQEELGDAFYRSFDFSSLTYRGEKPNRIGSRHYLIHHYLGSVTAEQLSKVVMHSGALGSFRFINKDTEIFPMSSGKDPREHIVVFDDQYEVLQELFHHGT